MKIIRPELLYLSGIAASATLMSKIAWALTQAGSKLTQILRKDLESQGQVLQETVVSVAGFGPGTARSMAHASRRAGAAACDRRQSRRGNRRRRTDAAQDRRSHNHRRRSRHLARNENTSVSVKALVVHSRAAKDKPLIVVVKK